MSGVPALAFAPLAVCALSLAVVAIHMLRRKELV